MKFGVCVILYYPTYDELFKLSGLLDVFDFLYLVDNTDENIEYYDFIPKGNKIEYIRFKENKGIPYALNYIIKKCDKSFPFLCVLDQDSFFRKKDINSIKEYISKSHTEKNAIYAPTVIYTPKQEFVYSFDFTYKDYVITSGSFLNVNILRDEGIYYDEKYFIDRCEVDLCKSLRNSGYYIIEVKCSILYQELGYQSKSGYSCHTPMRHYYIFRNRFYYNRKFYSFLHRILLNVLQTARHLFFIIKNEDEKHKKITMLYFGYIDYKKEKMGKIDSVLKSKGD